MKSQNLSAQDAALLHNLLMMEVRRLESMQTPDEAMSALIKKTLGDRQRLASTLRKAALDASLSDFSAEVASKKTHFLQSVSHDRVNPEFSIAH